MIYVVYEVDRSLRKIVPKKQKYTVKEANERLISMDKFAEENQLTSEVTVTIYEDQEFLFKNNILVGVGRARSLILFVNETLNTVFEDTPESEKESLLDKLKSELHQESKPLINERVMSEIKEEKEKPVIIEKKQTVKPKPKRKVKNKSRLNIKLHIPKKFIFGFICVLMGVLLCGVVVLFVSHNMADSTQATNKADFDTLLKEGKYEVAVKNYPKKESEILDYLMEHDKKQDLNKINKQHSTELSRFYHSFMEKDWKGVVENKPNQSTTKSLAMLGYAYIKEGKIEEAKLLNKELKSETLSKQIYSYQLSQAYSNIQSRNVEESKKINDELKDSTLESDIGIAQSIVSLLNKYERDSNDSSLSQEEREEAKNNFEAWKINLKQVGEDRK